MDTIEEIILQTLPKEITEAIYLFGSYGTPYFDEANSDIDIGWYTNVPMDWFEAMEYRDQLEEQLGREVDLLINEKEKFALTYNILSGRPIGELSEAFCEWFDRFTSFAVDELKFLESVRRERESLV